MAVAGMWGAGAYHRSGSGEAMVRRDQVSPDDASKLKDQTSGRRSSEAREIENDDDDDEEAVSHLRLIND
jgi:hypothetical protein